MISPESGVWSSGLVVFIRPIRSMSSVDIVIVAYQTIVAQPAARRPQTRVDLNLTLAARVAGPPGLTIQIVAYPKR
jgi:hypothetical protein